MRHRFQFALGGVALLVAACAALLAGAENPTPTPGSYRAAVEATLARRGIEHQGVRVVDSCAPTYQHCGSYRGEVTVQVWKPLQGVIECRWRWTGCALTIAGLGLHAEPLLDSGAPLTLQDLRQLVWDSLEGLRRAVR